MLIQPKLILAVFLTASLSLCLPMASYGEGRGGYEKIESIDHLLEILADNGGPKTVLPAAAKRAGEHVANCSLNNANNWNIDISLSSNKSFIYMMFPCCELPVDGRQDVLDRLMQKNAALGLLRFEYHERINMVYLVYPARNQDIGFSKLNSMTEELVATATATQSTWVQDSSRSKSKGLSGLLNEIPKSDSSKSETDSNFESANPMARLNALAKRGFTANYTFQRDLYAEGSKQYQGTVTVNPDKSLLVSAVVDGETIQKTGAWYLSEGGLHITLKDSGSCDLFVPGENENGMLELEFSHGTPTRGHSPGSAGVVQISDPHSFVFFFRTLLISND